MPAAAACAAGLLLRALLPRTPASLALSAVAGFAAGVVERGGWPALPPPDAFWWAVWAAPVAGCACAAWATARPPARPPRAPWPVVAVALLLGYGMTVRSSYVLGSLCALWGAGVGGAALAHLGTPRTRAFGAGTTSLIVLAGLLLSGWRYAAFPLGPALLLLGALLCVTIPLPRHARVYAVWFGLGAAAAGAWWAHLDSRVLDLY